MDSEPGDVNDGDGEAAQGGESPPGASGVDAADGRPDAGVDSASGGQAPLGGEGDSPHQAAAEASTDGPLAPEHWSTEDRESFNKAPPETREWFARRYQSMEADYTRKMQEIGPMRQVAQHWGGYLQNLGVGPEQALNNFLETDAVLRQGSDVERRQALMRIAQDYGITMGPVEAAPEGAPEPTAEDMIARAVQQQVQQATHPLAQAVTQQQQFLANQAQAAQYQRAESLSGEIMSFREAKDEAGEPAHPHFAEVYDAMVEAAHYERASGRQPVLADLYDKAVWANPDVREKAIAARTGATRQAQRQRVASARRAGASIAPGTGGVSAPESEHAPSLDEALNQAFDRFG